MNPQPDIRRSPVEPDRLRVTVTDVATGEVLGETVIFDDYLLVCAGHPHLTNVQYHGNGTHVLTVKDAGPRRSHHFVRHPEARHG